MVDNTDRYLWVLLVTICWWLHSCKQTFWKEGFFSYCWRIEHIVESWHQVSRTAWFWQLHLFAQSQALDLSLRNGGILFLNQYGKLNSHNHIILIFSQRSSWSVLLIGLRKCHPLILTDKTLHYVTWLNTLNSDKWHKSTLS